MIPDNVNHIDVEVIQHPTHTYRLDFETNRIVRYTDGLPAIEQFVFKALQTNRYKHEIYDWNYGFEIDDLMGKPLNVAKAKLPGRIREALIHDDRVTAVDNFIFKDPENNTYSPKRNTVHVEFTVHTIYGALSINQFFNLGGA